MGKFMYSTPATSVEFDDRVLAHLRVVIIAKLRRGESFTFSWVNTSESGGGRNCVWLNPCVSLQFEFYGSKEPDLNRKWLEALACLTNTPAGLQILPEPPEPTPETTEAMSVSGDVAADPGAQSAGKSFATKGTKLPDGGSCTGPLGW